MLPKIVAIDIETTGLDWVASILTIGLAYRGNGGEIVRESRSVAMVDLFTQATPKPALRHWLQTACKRADLVAMHNTVFDLSYLMRDYLLDEEDITGKLLDTLLLARMTDKHESVSLANVAQGYGLGKAEWFAMKGERKHLANLPPEKVLSYNEDDAELTLLVAEKLYTLGLTIYTRDFMVGESDYCRVMAKIRVRGRAIDRPHLEALIDSYQNRQKELLGKVLIPNRIGGPSNHTDLIAFLKKEGVQFKYATAKGAPTVAEKALLELKLDYSDNLKVIEIINAVLLSREIEKRLSTWLVPIYSHHTSIDGRVHANYSVAGAFTYRLTANEPGVQAMPKDLKLWGRGLSCDIQTAEMRLGAAYAADSNLSHIFFTGGDLHLETSRLMFGDELAPAKRKVAKQANFAAIYFSGPKTLAMQTGITVTEAETILKHHKQVFFTLAASAQTAMRRWEDRGYLTLICGKRIYLPDSERGLTANRWGRKESRTYKAFNNLIQGGVAGIVQRAMCEFDRLGYPMTGQTHDEINFDPDFDYDPEVIRDTFRQALPQHISERTDPPITIEIDIDGDFNHADRDNTESQAISTDIDLQSVTMGENEHDL